jgi:sulfatase maturation enzyme AslB (radical SAM superfamily)
LTKKWIQKLLNHRTSITISIDGVTKSVYEKIRIGANFDLLIKNLILLNSYKADFKSGLKLTLHATVMKSNAFQIREFIRFAKKYSFSKIELAPILGGENSEENIFSSKDIRVLNTLSESIERANREAKLLNIYFDDRITPLIKQQNIDKKKPSIQTDGNTPVCFSPWKSLMIFGGNMVHSNCYCSKPIGDISKESILNIWNGRTMQEYRELLLNNKHQSICPPHCVNMDPTTHHKNINMYF